jgi:hypothetical protein
MAPAAASTSTVAGRRGRRSTRGASGPGPGALLLLFTARRGGSGWAWVSGLRSNLRARVGRRAPPLRRALFRQRRSGAGAAKGHHEAGESQADEQRGHARDRQTGRPRQAALFGHSMGVVGFSGRGVTVTVLCYVFGPDALCEAAVSQTVDRASDAVCAAQVIDTKRDAAKDRRDDVYAPCTVTGVHDATARDSLVTREQCV